jgi:BASS family bile acid:Na+ symporter
LPEPPEPGGRAVPSGGSLARAARTLSTLALLPDRWVRGLGRHATWFLATGIFLGVAIPPLAALARPLITPAIFLLMLVTLLRIDPTALRAAFRRPLLLAATVAWVLVLMPLALWPALEGLGIAPFLADHLLLTAASAPIVSVVAFALLLGLDAAFALAVGVVATVLVPFTLPLLAGVLLGLDLPISAQALLLRLVLLIGGAAVLATLVRRGAGEARVARQAPLLDGLAVVALLAFGLAVMDGVTLTALERPGFALACVAATFALSSVLMAAGTLLFVGMDRRTALTVGLLSAFNNFGVVVAAMGASATDATVVYLGIAQFPIYLLPLALKPLVLRFGGVR